MNRFFLPLGVFALLVALLVFGLHNDPREIPSPLIDKPAPDFLLPRLHDPSKKLGTTAMRGQIWLLNVWASWCRACEQEQALLVKLADDYKVTIIGLNYKDEVDAARAWLRRNGDPYKASVSDSEGHVGIDYGVYGVPETFIIDQKGIVRYKHIGPVLDGDIESVLLPWIRKLQQESGGS